MYKYDISIPPSSFQDVIDTLRSRCEDHGLIADGSVKAVIGYGHVGDGMVVHLLVASTTENSSGNLHVNVSVREYKKDITEILEPFVYELVGE